MSTIRVYLFIFVFALYSCSDDDAEEYQDIPQAELNEEFSGGQATVFNTSSEAFGFAIKQLTEEQELDFGVGNSFFRQSWVTAPASTTARDGLGPYFNAVSCSSCHFKDGRGRAPLYDGELGHGLLLRLSRPGVDALGFANPDPIYGSQLQDNVILGQTLEGKFNTTFQEIIETLGDGTQVTLKKPIYSIVNLGFGALASDIMISPRVANQVYGLGLIEAVDEQTLLSLADPNDANNDGISGKANYVHDFSSNSKKIGRFGWKSNQPSIKQQVAAAFLGDMGITSPLFPNENAPSGVNVSTIANGGAPEITDENFNRVVSYCATLAVPARRDVANAKVLNGKKIFNQIQCASCHTPKIQTGNNHPIERLRNQTIRPYSDFLLHDMGDDLADNTPDFMASGKEWRTQPLWGIGLIKTVNEHTNLMHDGRAKNVTEAILWHGGEAQNAKNQFKKLSKQKREELLLFIESL
jgi:CxxC motif-containing protein (DUF1111 family)